MDGKRPTESGSRRPRLSRRLISKAATILPWKYVAVRTLQMIPTLFGISLIGFIVVQIAPGDFAAPYRLNPEFSAKTIAELERKFGFDKPVYVQYFRWIGNAVHLDFGESTAYKGMKVFPLIATRAMVTLRLSLLVMVVTWLISIPLGIYCAMRQYTFSDKVFSVLAFIGMSLPTFFVAFLLLMLGGAGCLLSRAAFFLGSDSGLLVVHDDSGDGNDPQQCSGADANHARQRVGSEAGAVCYNRKSKGPFRKKSHLQAHSPKRDQPHDHDFRVSAFRSPERHGPDRSCSGLPRSGVSHAGRGAPAGPLSGHGRSGDELRPASRWKSRCGYSTGNR